MQESVSGENEARLRVETSANGEMSGEAFFIFGWNYGTIQDNFLSKYKGNNTYLKINIQFMTHIKSIHIKFYM